MLEDEEKEWRKGKKNREMREREKERNYRNCERKVQKNIGVNKSNSLFNLFLSYYYFVLLMYIKYLFQKLI